MTGKISYQALVGSDPIAVSANFPLPVAISGGLTGLAVAGVQAPGAVATANPVIVGGVDGGGIVRDLLTTTSGAFVGAGIDYVTCTSHATNTDQNGNTNVAAAGRKYQVIAINSAAIVLGGGLVGDALDQVWLYPNSVTPGAVSIADNATVIWSWPAGQTLANLAPIFVPLNLAAVNAGGWKITTPATFTALASGRF